MSQTAIDAVFMRGGTSRALFFHQHALPAARADWDPILLAALGSPDPNGRQLDGMGGGLSSLSKIAVIGPPSRPDADVDYTFAQVAIDAPVVGYTGNCGNISSAVGPFAVDEGLVRPQADQAVVRIHNTNTGKIIVARFPVENGKAAVQGDFVLQGVAGTGAPIRLAFQDPGGAATGRLLPTGNARDRLEIPGLGPVEVSLVDAANPVVFVAAASLGITAAESPAALTADQEFVARAEDIRVQAAVAMGLAADEAAARTRMRNMPLVAVVAPPVQQDSHVLARFVSSGQPHKASPLTAAMCLAVAAHIPGSVVQACARLPAEGADLVVAHPSGLLPVAARIRLAGNAVIAEEAVVYRTARRLMQGQVLLPG